MTLTLIDKCRIFIAAIAQNFHPYAFAAWGLTTFNIRTHTYFLSLSFPQTHSHNYTTTSIALAYYACVSLSLSPRACVCAWMFRVMLLVGCSWCRSFQIAIISYNGACFVTIMYYTEFYAVLWYCATHSCSLVRNSFSLNFFSLSSISSSSLAYCVKLWAWHCSLMPLMLLLLWLLHRICFIGKCFGNR